jgi:hypothetical protein
MAAATRRTFEKVKSSPMTPRQPSVPNLIESAMKKQKDAGPFLRQGKPRPAL